MEEDILYYSPTIMFRWTPCQKRRGFYPSSAGSLGTYGFQDMFDKSLQSQAL